MKQWSKWLLKEGLLQWHMFPEPIELLLIGYSIESILTPRSKSKKNDTKNQFADMLTMGKIHTWRNGIIFCVCLTSAIFSSAECSEVMSKRKQKESMWRKSNSKVETNDEFDRAKQRKGSISEILYCFTKTDENQTRKSKSLSPQAEKHDRTVRPVVCSQRAHQFIVENDETESELSLGSRSFLHKVNGQVRKRQKQSSIDATEDSEETFCDMGNVYVFNIASVCIHGEELLRQLAFHQKYRISHDENRCSTYLRNWYPNNQTRSMEWKHITGTLFMVVFIFGWWWRRPVSCTQRSTYFQILYNALERWTRTHNQICHVKTDWRGWKVHHNTELWTEWMVSQLNSSGTFS